MNVETVLFDKDSSYGRMADVLRHTIELNSPTTPLKIHHIQSDDSELLSKACSYVWAKTSYLDNARKTKYHHNIVQEAQNGDELCLIDCDTFVLRSLADIGHFDFDLAITHRPHSKYPINTGVVFVRVSERTKEWYQRWYLTVQDLMADKQLVIKTHPKYGGINQCALGLMRERPHNLKIVLLPCTEWNLTSDLHHKFQENHTRVVHVHGQLRHRIVSNSPVGGPKVLRLEKIWRNYERECSRKASLAKNDRTGHCA